MRYIHARGNPSRMATYLKTQGSGVLIFVKLQPRASRNEIGEVLGNEIKIKVTAPPVDSAANEALVRFLAEILNVPRSTVRLVRGQTSKHKQIFVQGLSMAHAEQKLR